MTYSTNSTAAKLLAAHAARLADAKKALSDRSYWSGFPEIPSEKIHGEGSAAKGKEDFLRHLGGSFKIRGVDAQRQIGEEISPFGIEMGISYPASTAPQLLEQAQAAAASLASLDADARAGVALEALDRLWRRSFELAHAVMHTTGQGFMMAFQAGAPHAFDRALESVAAAHSEIERLPGEVRWEKPRGKREPMVLTKNYRAMPKGTGLVIGCATFPTWNSYPAIFANLVCGNPVIVKPHPSAVLPLAITVDVLRGVLDEIGADPNGIQLAVDSAAEPIAKDLACAAQVKLVDFTGSSEFGEWLESHATQARVLAEKSGVNCALIGEDADLGKVAGNLALSLSLYSGQMCTTPQNIYVPKKVAAEFEAKLAGAIDSLLGDERRAAEVLGAIQSTATLARVEQVAALADTVRGSDAPTHPEFPEARMRSPLVAKLAATEEQLLHSEQFGPVSFIVEVADWAEGLELCASCLNKCGALTVAAWSGDERQLAQFEELAARSGAQCSINLEGDALVNHSVAYSDYHGSGANRACSASFTDGAFINSRFFVAQSKRHSEANAGAE